MGWKSRLFSFRGRFSRGAYWVMVLANIAAMAAILLLFAVLGTVAPDPALTTAMSVLAGLAIVAQVWIILAAMVRRLHDRDKSAWWILVFAVVPSILQGIGQAAGRLEDGGVAAAISWVAASAVSIWGLIEFGFLRGTTGGNRFGPDPLAAVGTPLGAKPRVAPPPPPAARRFDPWKR